MNPLVAIASTASVRAEDLLRVLAKQGGQAAGLFVWFGLLALHRPCIRPTHKHRGEKGTQGAARRLSQGW